MSYQSSVKHKIKYLAECSSCFFYTTKLIGIFFFLLSSSSKGKRSIIKMVLMTRELQVFWSLMMALCERTIFPSAGALKSHLHLFLIKKRTMPYWHQIKCIHCPFMVIFLVMEVGQYINNSLSLNEKTEALMFCQKILYWTNKNKTNVWNYVVSKWQFSILGF